MTLRDRVQICLNQSFTNCLGSPSVPGGPGPLPKIEPSSHPLNDETNKTVKTVKNKNNIMLFDMWKNLRNLRFKNSVNRSWTYFPIHFSNRSPDCIFFSGHFHMTLNFGDCSFSSAILLVDCIDHSWLYCIGVIYIRCVKRTFYPHILLQLSNLFCLWTWNGSILIPIPDSQNGRYGKIIVPMFLLVIWFRFVTHVNGVSWIINDES